MLGDQDNCTEWVAGAPVPDNAIVSVPFEALLLMLMLPEALPVLAGAKVAVRVTDWPGVKIVPADTPLALKPAPDTITFEMVMLALPALVSVKVCWPLLAMLTEPKLKLVELAFRM